MKTLFWVLATFLASPLLFLGARLRKRNTVKKILVVQLAKLGDMVCTTPMFRAIKAIYPDVEVHVLCRRGIDFAIKNNPYVDAIHYDGGNRWKTIRELEREHFDWSIGCMPSTFTSMVGIWALVPSRVHTSSSHHGILMRLLKLVNQHGYEYQIHTRTFDHYMKLLEPMGVAPVPYQLDFTVTDEAKGKVESWMQQEGLSPDSFVVLNLTAGNVIKQWPIEKYVALAGRIENELHKHVVFSTLDSSLVEQARSQVSSRANTHDASGLPLEELGGLSQKAAGFVAVDTGPMFVAYACRSPVVVLVGGSHPNEQIPPIGEHVAHVLPPEGCEPWIFVSRTPRKGTPEQLRCIKETEVDDVFDALKRVIR